MSFPPNSSNKSLLTRVAVGSALISAMAPTLSHAETKEHDASQSAQTLNPVVVTEQARDLLNTDDSTATKMDVSIKDTGRSVVQLNAASLQEKALRDIREAFDYVAGFRGNGPADRTYTARGIRTPIDNVMVDGLRSLQGGEAGTGSRLPSTFNAESSTFLRGPEGLLYGSGVGGGVVNITTKKPSEEASTSVSLNTRSYLSDDTGNFDRNQVTLGLDSTGPVAGDSVLYRVIAETTPSGDHFQEGREVDEVLLDAALTFKIGDNTKITPRFESTKRDRTGGSGYADGVFESNYASGTVEKYGDPINRGHYYGSPKDKGENQSKSFDLTVEHKFSEAWKLTARGRSNETDSDSLDLYISDSRGLGNTVGDDTVNRKWVVAKGRDEYKLFDAAVEGKFKTGNIEHHLLGGVSIKDTDVNFARVFQANDDAVGKNTISVSNPSNQQVGPIPDSLNDPETRPRNEKDTNIYIKDRVKIGDFTVAAGIARVEQDQEETRNDTTYDKSFGDNIWDLGVLYALNPNLNLFATYSRSYDPVSARQIAQYGQGKTDYDPVEGNNYEVGFKGTFLQDRLATAFTLFRLERENATDWERVDGVWHLKQKSGTSFKSEGVEIDGAFKANKQWTTSFSYAFTRAYDTHGDDEGKQANNTPKHALAVWNSYRMSEDSPLRFGLGLRYEDERFDGDYVLPSYVEADLGVYYATKQWDFSAVLKNALDENRAEAGANWVTVQPNQPRSLNLGFKYHF